MPRINKKYEPELKIKVVEDMRKNHLEYHETARKYGLSIKCNGYDYPAHNRVQAWERIYLEQGPEGFYVERRGRGSKK